MTLNRYLVLFLIFADAAGAVCLSDPSALQSRAREKFYLCTTPSETPEFCSSVRPKCERIDLEIGNRLLKKSAALRTVKKPERLWLMTYLSALNWHAPISTGPKLVIQTGRYPALIVNKLSLNSKCLVTILHAAYRLHKNFPDYNFVVDSNVQNCQNLRAGVRQMIAQHERVKANLDKFSTPLHSVFLTNKTKFNNYVLGKMGLYIDVNRDGEIKRRLIDNKIGSIEQENIQKVSTVSN